MPRFLRVIAAPRQVFANPGRHGLFTLLALVFFEFVLLYPAAVTTCIFRLVGAPGHAVWGFLGAFGNYAVSPVFAVMAGGWMLYFGGRLQKSKIEPWLGTSALSYAWMPHVLLVCIGALVTASGARLPVFPQVRDVALAAGTPLWWVRQGLQWLPMAIWTGIAARTLLEHPMQTGPLPEAEGPARAAARVGLVLLLAAPVATVAQVHAHWADMQPVRLGGHMPHFQVAGLERDDLDSDSLADQVVLLNFWATWCGPCVEEMPRLQAVHDAYHARDFAMVALNIEADNLPQVKGFLQSHGLSLPVYEDWGGRVQERFGVHTYPTSFLIDRHGVVQHIWLAPPDADELRRSIEALLVP